MKPFAVPLAIACLLLGLSHAFAGEDFHGQDLPMRDFSNRPLVEANFSDAKLFLAKFNQANLTRANFQEADLTSASFNYAQCTGADFRDAIFKYASMQNGDFTGANFQQADLANISFQGSTLRGTNLRGARGIGDVLKADLREADLRGAVFTCTLYYMEGCRLRGAKYDQNTRWPQGFDVQASGAVLTASDVPPPAVAPPFGSTTIPAPPIPAPPTIPALPLPPIPPLPVAPTSIPPLPIPANNTPRVQSNAPQAKPAKLDDEVLTEAVIKYLLETEMWAGKDTSRFNFNYRSLKIAAPRAGRSLGDIASGKPRLVTPVRVQLEMIKNYDNNQSTKTDIHQDYEFFRDEFGTWTYRFQGNL